MIPFHLWSTMKFEGKRIQLSYIVINKKWKQQQNNNLLVLVILMSEHFQLEYKLKKTQTKVAIKKVELKRCIATATIRKMEENAIAFVIDTKIKKL